MAEQFREITQTAWYTLCSWMTAGINSCGTFISLQVWWLLTFCFAQQKYYVRSTYAQSLVDGSLMAAELEGVLVQQHCTFKHNAHIYKAIDIKGLGKLYLLKNDCFWPVILYKQRPSVYKVNLLTKFGWIILDGCRDMVATSTLWYIWCKKLVPGMARSALFLLECDSCWPAILHNQRPTQDQLIGKLWENCCTVILVLVGGKSWNQRNFRYSLFVDSIFDNSL